MVEPNRVQSRRSSPVNTIRPENAVAARHSSCIPQTGFTIFTTWTLNAVVTKNIKRQANFRRYDNHTGSCVGDGKPVRKGPGRFKRSVGAGAADVGKRMGI